MANCSVIAIHRLARPSPFYFTSVILLSMLNSFTTQPSLATAEIKEQRSEHIRESWVRAMEVRITRDMLETCYTTEGVNSQQHCSELAQKYLGMLKDHKVSTSFSFSNVSGAGLQSS